MYRGYLCLILRWNPYGRRLFSQKRALCILSFWRFLAQKFGRFVMLHYYRAFINYFTYSFEIYECRYSWTGKNLWWFPLHRLLIGTTAILSGILLFNYFHFAFIIFMLWLNLRLVDELSFLILFDSLKCHVNIFISMIHPLNINLHPVLFVLF